MSTTGDDMVGRLAGAPISWGVCEVPGWGVMLPVEQVLSEMRQLGLKATELGALGYLGDTPGQIRSQLAKFSLNAVGGFVPLALHDRSQRVDTARDAERAASLIAGAGGEFFVTAAVVDEDWSAPFELEERQWDDLAYGLATVERICKAHGLRQVLHPHVGTLVERGPHIEQVLERSEVALCLDTGHLAIGGVDPVAFARAHGGRIGLVHLKDVDLSLARSVREHELTLLEGTRAGLFRPLGRGEIDVAAVVRSLENSGYRGWYVLEQDTAIGEDAVGSADPAADVRVSIDYLVELTADAGW